MKLQATHLVRLATDHVEVLKTQRRFNREIYGASDSRVGEVEAEQKLNDSARVVANALPDMVELLQQIDEAFISAVDPGDFADRVETAIPRLRAVLATVGAT